MRKRNASKIHSKPSQNPPHPLQKKQKVDKILFVDIKSGKARLSAKQKKIKTAVEEKQVEFKTYKP